MENNSSRIIVFITGAFIRSSCWDEWAFYFKNRGYNCIAPAWPFKDATPEELRNRHPDRGIASNKLDDLTDYFAAIINELPVKPIMVGHSIGGLVAQLLLHRGFGSAVVAIHSFPPYGVCNFNFSFVKALWEATSLFTSAKTTYLVRFKKWKHIFANGMNCELQKELYYRYATPESKAVIRDSLKCRTEINFTAPHNPLLFIAGGQDRLISALLNYINYKKYEAMDSITHYRLFKDRNHLVFGHPAWIEDAEFVLHWLQAIK